MFWVEKRTVKNKCQTLIFQKKEKTLISKLKIAFKMLIFIIDDRFGRLYYSKIHLVANVGTK